MLRLQSALWLLLLPLGEALQVGELLKCDLEALLQLDHRARRLVVRRPLEQLLDLVDDGARQQLSHRGPGQS